MIKLWSTLKKLDELGFDHIMVHTGQNFTPELKDFFFEDLKLRKHARDFFQAGRLERRGFRLGGSLGGGALLEQARRTKPSQRSCRQ